MESVCKRGLDRAVEYLGCRNLEGIVEAMESEELPLEELLSKFRIPPDCKKLPATVTEIFLAVGVTEL